MASFETAWGFVKQKERGFVFAKGDRGGPTNMGVTSKAWRKYQGMEAFPFPVWSTCLPEGEQASPEQLQAEAAECDLMRALTEPDVLPFYRAEYWDPVAGDQIQGQGLATSLFDEAVNAGVHEAVKLLQRLVGVPDDGAMGPATVAAANQYSTAAGSAETGAQALARKYAQRRIDVYHEIADSNPADRRFLAGWDARARDAAEVG